MKQPVNTKPFGVIIHIISWGIVFGFPFFFLERGTNVFNWSIYLRHMTVPLAFLIVFYINYLVLIPRYLFTNQNRKYVIYNVFLVIIMGIALQVWQELSFTLMEPNIPKRKPNAPPRWIFTLRDTVSLIFTIGLSAAIRMSGRWRESELALREAEKSRTEAELRNLRNQLNPHFLLNTLNNIYALIAFNSDKAQQAVQDLSKLLRHVLYENQHTYVPLGQEADFIQNYIELMRIRLTDNVKVETVIHIQPESKTFIAPLIFISLIENAFKHGISPTEPSFIRIVLNEKPNLIYCEITNSNFPKNKMDKSGSGIGLEQVSKRLELLYPNHYKWEKYLSADGKEYISKLYLTPTNNRL